MSIQTDDLSAVASALSETRGVVDAGVFGDGDNGVRCEAILSPEYDGIPAHVVHVVADHNVVITDVSRQGSPAHYVLTVQ